MAISQCRPIVYEEHDVDDDDEEEEEVEDESEKCCNGLIRAPKRVLCHPKLDDSKEDTVGTVDRLKR